MSAPARELAWLSALIYVPTWEQIDDRLAEHGWRMINQRDHAEAQVMMVTARAADTGAAFAAIVFRGTEASRARLRDLIDNLGICRAWAGEGRAHSGYLTGLERVRYSVRRWAEGLPMTTPLYVTGHSMGGALATLFAAWYYTDWPEDRLAGLVTFGAPKAIDAAGAAPIRCPIERYAIPVDFAPHWPPSFCLAHPAPAISLRSARRWPGPISRHSIDNYIASILPA